jgi:hypothetical protein
MNMKFGFGNISMWANHYNHSARTILKQRYAFDSMLIVDFIKATENRRRKIMGPGTAANLRRIRELEAEENERESLREALGGWDKCHIPVTDIFRHDDVPENCPACGGIGAKRSRKLSVEIQCLSCNDCGANFIRPVKFGVILTKGEVEI